MARATSFERCSPKSFMLGINYWRSATGTRAENVHESEAASVSKSRLSALQSSKSLHSNRAELAQKSPSLEASVAQQACSQPQHPALGSHICLLAFAICTSCSEDFAADARLPPAFRWFRLTQRVIPRTGVQVRVWSLAANTIFKGGEGEQCLLVPNSPMYSWVSEGCVDRTVPLDVPDVVLRCRPVIHEHGPMFPPACASSDCLPLHRFRVPIFPG